MAKRRKAPPLPHPLPHPAPSSHSRLIPVLIILVALVLASIPFAYGKYLEFNTNGAFDGGLNVYSAQCIVNGQKLGTDVLPSARPATLLVNVVGVALFGFSEFGPKLIQALMQIAALALMFYTLRKLYGVLPAAVALVLAAFYLSCPPYAKFGNVKEQFMITCMIAAVCAFILRYINGPRWWLLISGIAAINTWYFKPTGFSVVIAITIYLLAQPLLHRYHWRHMVADLLWLLWGGIIGLLPLTIFYTWQRQLSSFLNQFPASVLFLLIKAVLVIAVLYVLLIGASRLGTGKRLRQVPKPIWIALTSVLILLLVGCIIHYSRQYYQDPEVLNDSLCGRLALKVIIPIAAICTNIKGLLNPSAGYLTGSRSVTDFAAQFNNVMRYYSSFVVPIGLALLAVLLRGVVVVSQLFSRVNGSQTRQIHNPDSPEALLAERFVCLLALWWILDMLFVWVSPRSYVEYFLPLNASAALLGSYVLYRAGRNSLVYVLLLLAWLAVDFLLRQTTPLEHFPYIGLSIKALTAHLSMSFLLKCIPFIAALVIYILMRAKHLNQPRLVILFLLCCIMAFWWNGPNFKSFADKTETLRTLKQTGGSYPWEQLAHYIRDHSSPDDGLYVWGWYPGIYVQAQRFCPSPRPAYGDMHTDTPKAIRYKTDKLLEDLKKHPPKFIVDSQKLHFPYYEHPNFDLWPQWQENNRGKSFYLRYMPNQQVKQKDFISLPDLAQYQLLYDTQVEWLTNALLTNDRRKGGPMPPEQAAKLAQLEKQRHQALTPLRQFVMENYRPIPLQSPMHLFEYVPKANK